jgi:hypothetical protein
MLSDVRDYYGLVREISRTGQTAALDRMRVLVCAAANPQGTQARDQGRQADRLVGHRCTGKTTILQKIQELLFTAAP